MPGGRNQSVSTRINLTRASEYNGSSLITKQNLCPNRSIHQRIFRRRSRISWSSLMKPAGSSNSMKEVGRELSSQPVDIAFVGIGDNGHLAFNERLIHKTGITQCDFLDGQRDPQVVAKRYLRKLAGCVIGRPTCSSR
jgi:hypothetical protein